MLITVVAPEFDISEHWLAQCRNAFSAGTFSVNEEALAKEVSIAIVDGPPPGALRKFEALRLIISLSNGVDGLLSDHALPNVPIVRLVPTEMSALMAEYVVYQALRIHRGFAELDRLQAQRKWDWQAGALCAHERRVLVLGLGVLGRAAAIALRDIGFEVFGWSRTSAEIPGVKTLVGKRGLEYALSHSDIVVCLLPLTDETRGILSAPLFDLLRRGAAVINVSRGACLNEADLVSALDCGQLGCAALDVFETEPLPSSSSLWTHPKIFVTPHTASYPCPDAFIAPLGTVLSSFIANKPLANIVNRQRGY